MMNNDLENTYEAYEDIVNRHNAAKDAGDQEKVKATKDEMHSLIESIESRGTDYCQVFQDYRDARECGNEYIDLTDRIFDEKVPAMIQILRNLGIDHFTFSSTYSSAVETAWLFTENGCSLEGMIQINDSNLDWRTGEFDRKPAFLFGIQ